MLRLEGDAIATLDSSRGERDTRPILGSTGFGRHLAFAQERCVPNGNIVGVSR